MADETIPPLPKGYTPVKSDNTIPPLPRGYSPVKKKVDTIDGGNTSPLLSIGSNPILSSLNSGDDGSITPIIDPHYQAIAKAQQARDEQKYNNIQPVNKQPTNKAQGVIDNIGQALYLPAFNKGFSDIIVKPLAGATDFLDRTTDKLYRGITGEETPTWLRKGGAFDKISNYYDQEYEKRDKPSNIASESVEGVVGALPLVASMFTGQGEASLAVKSPQLISSLTKTLAVTKGLSAFKDATDANRDFSTSLIDAGKGAGTGAMEGLSMEAQMMVGGALGRGVANKLAEKGLLGGKIGEKVLHALSIGTIFGSTSAAGDIINGQDVNTDEALKQFGTGLAFEMIPTAKAISDEVGNHIKNKSYNEKVLQTAAVSNAASNLHAESVTRTLFDIPTEQLLEINNNVKQGHEDLYANSLEAGVKAIDAKSPTEKKAFLTDQLLLKTQGDVKYLADKVGDEATKNDVIEQINNNDELPPEQKQDLILKINQLSEQQNNLRNEQPNQGAPIENNVSETPQANEAGVPETVGKEPIETTKNNITNESNEENGGESIAKGSEDQGTETRSNESGKESNAIPKQEKVREKVSDADAPTLPDLSHNLKEVGEPGIAIEQATKRQYGTNELTDEPLDSGTKHVVSRDKDGKVNGVLEISYNGKDGEQKEPTSVKVVVDEASRRKGIATDMFKAAKDNGIDLSSVRGKSTTDAGQALYESNLKNNENKPAGVAEQTASPTEPTANTGTEPEKTENKPSATNEKVSEKSSEPIGISKAETKKQREARGLEDLPEGEKTTLKNMFEEGKQSITDGNVKPRQLAIEISDKPRNLSSTEVNALLADRRALHDEADDLRNTLGGIDPEQNPLTHRDISDRLRHVEEQLDNNENALRKGARENALALVSMQNMINSDYSHSAQLSRMRAMFGGELTPAMKAEIERYAKERDEAIKALEDYKKGEAERLSKEHIDNEVKKARKAKKAESKESLKAERKVIVDDFLTELKKIRKSGSLSSDIPYRRELAAAAPFMQKMITNLVKDGIVEFKDVIETVHDEFSKHIDGLTKRDVMDAISGVYHEKKETKNGLLEQKNAIIRLSKLTTKLEDLQNGLPSEKSEKRIVKKRDDIVNLEKEIKTLEDIAKIPEKERNAVKSRAKQLEKQIADYEQRIKDAKLHPDAKEPKDYNNQNIKDLEGKRDELTAELKKMRQDEFTPEEKQQRSLQGRLERINERIKNNDYDIPIPQPKSIPTAKTIALQARVRRAENNFDAMAERLGNHSRGTFEKRLNLYRKINLAAILSGTKVLLKLIGYSAAKRFTNIMDEVANTVNSKTPFLKKIIDRSPRYAGGINARAEAKAIAARWNLATAKDVWETLGSGVGDLDRLYGKSGVDKDFEHVSTILDMFQHLHGAFKTSAKRAEFFRSMQHRLEFAAKQGEDINDPDVQFKAGLGAYVDAKRTILMSDNLLTDKFYKGGLQRLEQSDKSGKAVASFLRGLFPITKVPTNFVLNVYDRVTGAIPGLSRATPKIWDAMIKGAESLTPEEADSVARILAKGQVGLAFMAIAFFAKTGYMQLGGYYAGKRDKDDLKAGDVIIGGVHIPHNLAHNDLIEAMQFVTTVKRAMNSGQGVMIGIGQGVKGLTEQIPFVDSDYQKDLTSEKAAVNTAGIFIKNKIEPRLVQEAAEYGDKDTDVKFLQHPVDYLMSETKKRDPQTIGENLKTGIPGLRTQVQEKQEKKSEGLTNIKIDDGRNWTLKPSILKEREKLNEDFIKQNGDAIIRAYSESFNRDKQKREEAAFKKLWEGKGASPEIIKKWILNKREAKIKSYLQDKANDASKGFLLDKYEKEDGDYDLGELKD